MTKKEIYTAISLGICMVVGGLTVFSMLNRFVSVGPLGAVTNYLDTSSSAITHSTSTINTTSTQVFSSITKIGQIINRTGNELTCSMDATGTTAASSTVATNRGIILGAYGTATSTAPYSAMFGECYPGSVNCYAHKGAVNCLASATSSITKWSK